jgi:hypothetical protein
MAWAFNLVFVDHRPVSEAWKQHNAAQVVLGRPMIGLRSFERGLQQAKAKRVAEAAAAKARAVNNQRMQARQLARQQAAANKNWTVHHGEAVHLGDSGPQKQGGKKSLVPDQKNNKKTTRKRHSAEEMRVRDGENLYLRQQFAKAFDEAAQSLVSARNNSTGVPAEECCAKAEEKYDLPAGCISAGRIERVVRKALQAVATGA